MHLDSPNNPENVLDAAVTVHVHGARGSLGGAGPNMARYGTQTCCVEVRAEGRSVYLDAGTGIAGASAEALGEGRAELDIILTHLHLDHVWGLPFIPQMGRSDGRLRIWLSDRFGDDPHAAMSQIVRTPGFPVTLDEMPGTIEWNTFEVGKAFEVSGMTIDSASLNHPGGSTGLRVSHDAGVFAYATDHEPGGVEDENAVELMRDADIALIDAAFTPEELPTYAGWGHGDWRSCGELAARAGAKRWGLFHHHHLRTDVELDEERERVVAEYPNAFVAAAGDRYEL